MTDLPNREDYPSLREAEDSDEERELTNLNWLLRNQNVAWPKTIDSNTKESCNIKSVPHNSNIRRNQVQLICTRSENTVKKSKIFLESKAQRTIAKRPTPSERFEIFVNKVKRDLTEYEKLATKYETDVTEKPPFNYSHIIGMAMLKNGRITLQQICAWIEAKFAFFRVRKKWNNSIRHNLSLHHCFRNRKREEKGKGGYWELGVDPKKCERKRIRNRKLSHAKLNQTAKYHYSLTTQNNAQPSVTKGEPLSEKEHVKLSQPYYSRLAKMARANNFSEISVANHLKKLSSTPTKVNFEDSIAEVNGIQFENCPLRTTINEDIFQKKYELEKIKFSAGDLITEPQNLNCFISHKLDSTNTISGDDDFSAFDNINIYSDMTPVLACTLEDQIITSDISGPCHPCNITINYDYTNFRPLVENIDDQYQFRNDDLLDNLLDVCITRY
ncbi:forkhead transcription factor HCM1 isoform X2 [Drosophila rhopaloa]|uniref:Forkhead transcription factor HCM1 isoform X2 n=1 Tax=Drosophila rhopaloa TaxID=1041015 RepID=A0A6P4FRS2_DRORH|nr:forkhead transcription factor HCM1 isoform X2 [Drosophila rhopaloa]